MRSTIDELTHHPVVDGLADRFPIVSAGILIAWERARLPSEIADTPLVTLLETRSELRERSDALRVARWVSRFDRALNRVPGISTRCLPRSIARFGVLRRFGLPVRFAMGLDPRKLDHGHAWLELDGRVYDEAPGPFVETYSYPPKNGNRLPT